MTSFMIDGRRFVEYPPLGGYAAAPETIPRTTVFIAHCLSCNRMAELDRETTISRYRVQHLFEIERKLRCTCGARSARLITGYWPIEGQCVETGK